LKIIEENLNNAGFYISSRENISFLANLLMFRLLKEKFPILHTVDQFFSKKIPFFFASGWGIVAIKRNVTR